MKMVIWLLITATLVLLCAGVVWYIQEKSRRQELENISVLLEKILNEKEIGEDYRYEDTISSKIYHQLCRLDQKTKGYHKRIEADRDAIKSLITEIAHQLRTPLTNMETYLEFLEEEGLEKEEQKLYLKAVRVSEQKVSFLIESFIKMSRLENRIIQIRLEDENLLSTLEHAKEQVTKHVQEKNIIITTHFPEKLLFAHDSKWMEEAIFNLLDNSVKYSHNGGEIHMEVEENEMAVCIRIRDYGVGIEEGEEEKVFQRFYRGKNAGTRDGFGLGLYITREILLQHHGTIKIRRENPGLSVLIFLLC